MPRFHARLIPALFACALWAVLIPAIHASADAVSVTAAAVSPGFGTTCALTVDGGVRCWGAGFDGELGDGQAESSLTSVGVAGLMTGVQEVSVGGGDACVITSAGGAKCWGQNLLGAVGDGTKKQRNAPVNVSGLTSGVAQISVGVGFACAVTTAGGAKCWGQNDGDLGDGTTKNRFKPVNVVGLASGVASVAAGAGFACAVTTAGAVKCWGDDFYGELGDGGNSYSSVPVDVTGLSSGVARISVGDAHACALLQSGGLECWGDNGGDVGDGTVDQRGTPVAVTGLASGVVAVAAGSNHTCALLSSGGVKCWGQNDRGQLGDGTTTRRLIPTAVSGLSTGVSAIGAGSLDVCAVTLQGAATCWGDNAYGNLGDGSVTAHARPTAVYGIPSLPGPPVFGRMSPAKGAIDTRVVIKGKGLLGAMDVSFNGVDAGPPIVQSNKQIVIWVPSGATTGKVTITTPLGTVSSPHDFTVLP